MKTSQFDYLLPGDCIAAAPSEIRDQSRLMRLGRNDGSIKHLRFSQMGDHLSPNSLIVLNDTRVLPARLLGKKSTGGAFELFLVRRVATRTGPGMGMGMGMGTGMGSGSAGGPGTPSSGAPWSDSTEIWEAIGRGLVGLSAGTELTFSEPGSPRRLEATLVAHGEGGAVTVSLRAAPAGETIAAVLAAVGRVPLPPYIEAARKRRMENSAKAIADPNPNPNPDAGADTDDCADGRVASETRVLDTERYQTVYADEPGAVAAPTAGLHFTEPLLAGLTAAGHEIVKLTLHVGLGTFRPVKVDDADDHVMDAEWYRIPPATAAAVEDARRHGRSVLAVGTTVVRALETAVRAGEGIVHPGSGSSHLFLRPGDRFQVVTDLVTNFHLPRSTLLMLVCAFAGRERVLGAYEEAIAHGYRFYSYGDAMLIRGTP